jgi:hypothetical protein
MKYSFRLYSTGPKTKLNVNWGLPLNLQLCPKCKALNHKMATLCSKCGHPLSESSNPDRNPAANSAPAAAHPTPDMLMANGQFAMSNEQKWLRRTWGLVLLVSIVVAFLIAVFSLRSPSAPPYTAKNPGNNTSRSMAIPPPLEPVPATVEQKTLPVVPDKALTVTDLVVAPAATPVLAEPEPRSPTLTKQSKRAALPRTTKFTDKKIARTTRKPDPINPGKAAPAASTTPEAPILQLSEPVTPVNTPCSEAARALALCNTNTN